MERKEKNLLSLILGSPKYNQPGDPDFDVFRESTLQMALDVARFLYAFTNVGEKAAISKDYYLGLRKINSVRHPSEPSLLLVTVLLYLNSLEQIGNIFSKNNEYGIRYAIKLFADKNASIKQVFGQDFDTECTMIQHLRHALAHNFGLVNIDPASKSPKEKFTLSYINDKSAKVVTLSKIKWNGDYADKSDETSVEINVPTLVKMTESIFAEAQNQFESIFESMTDAWFSEIQTRFTIRC